MKRKEESRNNVFRNLIDYFKSTEEIISNQEIEESWSKLKRQMDRERLHSQRRRFRSLYVGVASVAAVLLAVVWYNYYNDYKEDKLFDSIVSQIDTASIHDSDEILLKVNDKKQIRIKKGAVVTYSKNGSLSVDKENIVKEDAGDEDTEYNQLIVPKGKHTHLLLSDGSELHINAGTKVVYPRCFRGNKREIYVDGEIYIDVARNEEKPFIVKTSAFNVEVLGTAFNINAYKGMKSPEVVLVRGSVAVKGTNDGNTIRLVPNELARIESGRVIDKKVVDPSDYIAWMNGVLPLDGKNIEVIFHKLSVFYGEKILYDPSIKRLPLRGTIDLSVPLAKVLERISKIAPITYEQTGEGYNLRMKENVEPLK